MVAEAVTLVLARPLSGTRLETWIVLMTVGMAGFCALVTTLQPAVTRDTTWAESKVVWMGDPCHRGGVSLALKLQIGTDCLGLFKHTKDVSPDT